MLLVTPARKVGQSSIDRTPYNPIVLWGEVYHVALSVQFRLLVLCNPANGSIHTWSRWELEQSLREWQVKDGLIWQREISQQFKARRIAFYEQLLRIANQLGVK